MSVLLDLEQFTGGIKKSHIYRSGPGSAARLALTLLESGKSVTVVARDASEFAEYRSLLTVFSPEDSAQGISPDRTQWDHPFIIMPAHPAARGGKGGWAERMAALFALKMKRRVQGVLLTLDNFLLRLPPVDIFDDHELRLYTGMDMAPELVLEQAVDWGYTRVPMVSNPGDVAMRGDILDIFCPGYRKPLRLEFFGDTLDEIRLFEPTSQRSITEVKELRMLPVAPVIISKKLRQDAEKYWKEEVKKGDMTPSDVAGLTRMLDSGGEGLFSGTYYKNASNLEEWLPQDGVFILPGENDLALALEERERSWNNFFIEEAEQKDIRLSRARVLRPMGEVENFFAEQRKCYFEDLRIGVPESLDNNLSLEEHRIQSFQDIFPRPEDQERPWHRLVALMKAWAQASAPSAGQSRPKGPSAMEADWMPTPADVFDASGPRQFLPEGQGRMLLTFSSERSRTRFLKLAEQDGLIPKLRFSSGEYGLFALVAPFRSGIFMQWDNTLVLGEDVIQPKAERGKRPGKGAFHGLDNYDTLRPGDLLVHRDYGIGSFDGLHRMNLGGMENDYLLLRYAGDDKLYLPVDRLSLIQRFKGADEASPVLDRLGGSLWLASKDKAKKAIEKIAADLVEMYALRKVVKGFSYSPIGEMYREFEASFGFEETPDQARAIEDVLSDMEKTEPMDRLVCGDVGFGKTEVALRAAFRAAFEGRQVALLCPTTVLAEQHYQTFRSRLAGFPVNVGMLSRFVSRAKQKEVLEAAAKGQIDILIGTHRLLSKDISLPNLGLLILDEEQRFGVRHKERLKEMRKNVDALTLTATPIPRTLQLSLSGIRELSVIETPPPERKPVETILLNRDDTTLKGIVERELARKGQVFWVYNRVQGLERVAEYVKTLVPDARIGMAHGQMNETALEEAMHKFWHGDLDVLVCTAIIESGLDFPQANTLIVDQAQLFGLGQLYQLRGRVGRSDRQAYAVFVTPDPDRLSDTAKQRLRIIMDMDYLGAGFQVAMEDLRLRGAGNILGESQSGHMNRLGLDLFLEMLEEAVAKLKGQPMQVRPETELNIGIPALIPTEYMADNKERLRYYKTLSSAQDEPTLRDVVLEIKDRFGALPEELESFIAVLSFKRLLTKWGAQKADIFSDKIRVSFAEDSSIDPEKLIAYVTGQLAAGFAVKLTPPAVLEAPLKGGSVSESLDLAVNELSVLMKEESNLVETDNHAI